MTDDRSTDQIEREIELERVELARSLESLQRQFSPEVIVDRVSGMLRDNGGEFAGTALKQARDNPLALAVTGVGLAWLIAGPAKKQTGYANARCRCVRNPRSMTNRMMCIWNVTNR